MKITKKWIALFCAVAVLITLLVPLNGFAAESNAQDVAGVARIGEDDETGSEGSNDSEGSSGTGNEGGTGNENGGTAGDGSGTIGDVSTGSSSDPRIVKKPGGVSGEFVNSTLDGVDATGNKPDKAVALVNNQSVKIILEVQADPGTTYSWTRSGGLPEISAELKEKSTYVVSVANGDLTSVGKFKYTCILGGTSSGVVEFDVETVGATLEYVDAGKADLGVKFVSNVGFGAGEELLEAMRVKLSQQSFDVVNAGDKNIAQPSQRGRGVFKWTSKELGGNFDEYPYDDLDKAGAQYDRGLNEASFYLAVAYEDVIDGDLRYTYANQVAAGDNTYTVTATGQGIDPAKNARTFILSMVPELNPQPLTDEEQEQPDYASRYDRYTYDNLDAAQNSIDYTYATTNNTLSGRLQAGWLKGLVPTGVSQYVWTMNGQSYKTTSGRALSFSMDIPSDYDYTFKGGPDSQSLFYKQLTARLKSNPTELAKLTAALNPTFVVKVRKDVPTPEISSITATLNNEKVVKKILSDSTDYVVKVPKGDDLLLTVDASAGPDIGDNLDYTWTYQTDASGQNVVTVQASDTRYLLENDGKTLRILNAQPDIAGYQYTVTAKVKGRDDKVDQMWIRLSLEDPVAPRVTISSDPAADKTQSFTVSEGGTFSLTVAETNGISEGSLGYQWMQTKNVDKDGNPVDWVKADGGDASTKNPYVVTDAKRTLNDRKTYYKCIVTNTSAAKGDDLSAETSSISVKVNPTSGTIKIVEPTQAIDFETIENGDGGHLTFGVEAVCDTDAPIAYQWYMAMSQDGSDVEITEADAIAGATESTYSPGRMLEAGYFVFKCKAYNSLDEREFDWSPEFRLRVTQSSVIPIIEVTGDTEVGVTENGYVRLKVQAYSVSGEPLSYQWLERTADGWKSIDGATRPSITLSNLKVDQHGSQYKCRVTNLRQNVSNESKTFTVNVWRPEDVPVIQVQPKGWTVQSGTTEAAHPTLKTVVEAAGNNYIFNWQRYDALADEWKAPDLDQLDVATDETSSSTLEFTGTNAENGTYRCEIINQGGTPQYAKTYTNEVEVRTMMRSVPTIMQAPKSQIATIGKTVTLRVIADIHPEEELIYTWQTSNDGRTWRNCNGADGSGYDSSVFTTVPMKSSMGTNNRIYYRCIVEGAVSRVQAPENTTAAITIVADYPSFDPAETSKLEVTEDPTTGERYLNGYVASTEEHALTVRGVREDLTARDLSAYGGKYTIEVRDKNGNVLKNDDDTVTTGATATLLLTNVKDSDEPVPADEVTIVILGDVMGTGRMSISQLVTMANHIIGERLIAVGPNLEATDINGNGKYCDIGDLSRAARLLMGEED